MEIGIQNLPAQINQDAVRRLLHNDQRINRILLTDAGNSDRVLAWVRMDISRVEANRLIKRLSHSWYQDRHLQAYACLFFR
ncbi:RNA-binding protein [Marinobacterium jannaschii]|uniref:hypothetical protein n=1 Tax=Marinobacterium jannaschii TaxID=64970 RepID=UPI000489DE09|nr:hypothetical protein [Marinobacterium jannaschii]